MEDRSGADGNAERLARCGSRADDRAATAGPAARAHESTRTGGERLTSEASALPA